MKAKLKTTKNDQNVNEFLQAIPDEKKRADSMALVQLIGEVTGETPRMWGSSIVGFGSYTYRYDSGREGDWFLTGFSPRKQNITLYIMSGFEQYPELLKSLGKFTTGKSCLYIKRLEDIHVPALRRLLQSSIKHMARTSLK